MSPRHVTSPNQGLFSIAFGGKKRDPGNEVETPSLDSLTTAQQTTSTFTGVLSSGVTTEFKSHDNKSTQMVSDHKSPNGAATIGRSHHAISPQEVLHHYPSMVAGGRPVQQRDHWNARRTRLSAVSKRFGGAESWHSGYSRSQPFHKPTLNYAKRVKKAPLSGEAYPYSP
ncbi:hypothetical protein OS493_019538 [Desmophyllum pertusum]|uniref:Uncharacterized protein n=1 Tax=Desmophyllum pertusum TaxID=174260 RepID=A0A9W9ZNJ5_9CNID|nr:hypothetical protein OS493_019538 [Desmophyllum pertusum]